MTGCLHRKYVIAAARYQAMKFMFLLLLFYSLHDVLFIDLRERKRERNISVREKDQSAASCTRPSR